MRPSLKSATIIIFGAALFIAGCHSGNNSDLKAIDDLGLKRGDIISCGSPGKEFGVVDFAVTCDNRVRDDFNLAMELLHSFEYDEAEKVFARIIDQSPECVMAYWGVAMCNFHPLWEPPSEEQLRKGTKVIEIANALRKRSVREAAYVNAVAAYYQDWNTTGHQVRSVKFENAMEELHSTYSDDKEAAIIYALALLGAANPQDKSYLKQKKAGEILDSLYNIEPNHPGIIHYIIHAYDYPGLAELGLTAARRYAEVAPSSAHALHMPSHIFTRLGLWDDCIRSNTESVEAAKCYAQSSGIKGHWDEELHGMDYLAYAHLQKAENALAKQQFDYLQSIKEVYPANFKVAYAFAAIPSRYVLENKRWKDAASLTIHPVSFPWKSFPWQEAIFHSTRLLGAVHMGQADSAKLELKKLKNIYDTLMAQKDLYKAAQVMIQVKSGEAWIALSEGRKSDAVQFMTEAADLEDQTEKHPVTPGSIIPARELLGDLLMEMNKPEEALAAYLSALKIQPGRFNGLCGAALACEKMNDKTGAHNFYQKLLAVANSPESKRPELDKARAFLKIK